MLRSRQGFTLVELVLVITALGILAVSTLPNFINISHEANISARDGAIGAVREGISLYKANNLIKAGPPGIYPPFLDGNSMADHNGYASPDNPLFENVLSQPITDGSWQKSNYRYIHFDGEKFSYWDYMPSNGAFTFAY